MTDASTAPANPFFAPWTTPFGLPPFEGIAPEHYRPAFDRALEAHIGEIEAIAGDAATPSIANTVEAMERSGRELRRVAAVFFNLA
ncbi:MAG: peptidase M3, partial [Microvirga sp.]